VRVMDRKEALTRMLMDFLEKEDFSLSRADTRSSCFEIFARRRSFTILLKILLNIDSFSEEHARELIYLAHLFSGYPLLIGERTRNLHMQSGVLYNRQGVNAVTPGTFMEMIADGVYPLVCSSRGGYYVRIDGEKLRKVREERNLSAGELAEKAGVSRTMIYLYEHSQLGGTLSTAARLEELLNTPLALPLAVFTKPAVKLRREIELGEQKRRVFLSLERIGFEIHPVLKAPFDAVTADEEGIMLTKVDERPERMIREIRILRDVSEVASCSAFLVTSARSPEERYAGLPVIKSSELERMETRGELIEVLEDRG